jgi:hypothetical protein
MTAKRKTNPLSKMLDDPNKGIYHTFGAVGMLSRLFRTMLKDLDIGGYQFNMLMAKFLNDPQNKIPENKRDQTSNRGNLNKEFQKGTMTWKVFCKAMRFLQVRGFKLTIEARRANGRVTSHSVEVDLDMQDPAMDDFEDDGTLPQPDDSPHVPYLDYEREREEEKQ